MIVLTTERLILREIIWKDSEKMYELNSDEEVLKYTGDVAFESVKETEKFLKQYPDYERYGFGRWLVKRKSDNEIIGWCGLKKHEDNSIDLGYRFMKKFWNQGYATESSKACLDYGFEVLGLDEIVANADRENLASIRVMEKVGMKFNKFHSYDGIENAVLYKLTKQEFNETESNE